ncbi:PIG-L family deacetylase [Arthrobacter tumbae]|uniref:PIG-L deacetylase family protein n=1 Tax=Arthrobacter tumbae TaxID=163874 RepID=UPI00195EE6D7|nr:PIG-L deacetylase family protein [Arthrobacter tumbae]MBM7780168.1 LmbE family N-acetylglucosaminyl deacetylase [Arthrobacter tumbae]
MPIVPERPEDGVSRVLCFVAHPDDVDFGAAGTVARWSAAGVVVDYCIMTDGDAGGFSDEHRPDIVDRRREEQRAAARLVGVENVHFLGYRDGYLEPSLELVAGVVELIRNVRPQIVLSMHPERNWERIQKSHPDHLACGEAVTRAIYPAVENPYAFPELAARGVEAYRVPWLWFFGGPTSLENHFVDVTDHVEDKMRALRFHASQHPDLDRMDSTVRAFLAANAQRGDLAAGRSAEVFQVVPVNTDATIAGF